MKPENKDMKRIDKVQFIVLSLFFLLGCSRSKDEVYQDILRPVKVENREFLFGHLYQSIYTQEKH